MTRPMRAGALTVVAVALGIGLAACGSDSESVQPTETAQPTETTETADAPTSEPAPTTSPEPAAPGTTLDEYIAENDLVRTPVLPGDPGAPTIELPVLPGWTEMGPDAPEGAYSALALTEGPASEPATIVARVFQLTGNVDPAKVLEYGSEHLRALPMFTGGLGDAVPQPGTLSGFEAMTLAGIYSREGTAVLIAQKTVTIPGEDGLFVLQIDAEGTQEQAEALGAATAAIDKDARIVP